MIRDLILDMKAFKTKLRRNKIYYGNVGFETRTPTRYFFPYSPYPGGFMEQFKTISWPFNIEIRISYDH